MMKKISLSLRHPAIVVLVSLALLSCKDDDPAPPAKVSFATAETTVEESVGTIDIEVRLDRSYGKDLRIEYSVGGTASDQDAVGTDQADFRIEGSHGVVEIPAGATEGSITIEIIDDDIFEEDETIVLRITDTNTSDVVIGDISEHIVTITSDDPQLLASFTNTTMTVSEDDEVSGLVQVEVQLDNPAPADVVVTYSLGGTALDSLSAFDSGLPPMYYDYHVHGESGQLTIPAGATTGNIELFIYSDLMFEDDETIEITLEASGAVGVGTNSTITITILQQDGKVIALSWPDETTDVDMDLFLWIDADQDEPGVFAVSINEAVDPKIELIFLPKIYTDGLSNTTFGLSYNYYRGTADPLNFTVQFADFTNGDIEPADDRDIFEATYTAANIFPWFDEGQSPAIVQTFRIVNGEYVDFSDIMVPASGSRIRPLPLPPGLKRMPDFSQRTF